MNPQGSQLTPDVVYKRRHGEGGNCDANYSKTALGKVAGGLRDYVRDAKDVHIFQ